MQAKPYPEAKRRILAEFAKHNGNTFLEFFDKITGTERKQNLQQILPALKKGGFRKLDRQIKEQARLLAQRLTWEKEIENSSSQAWENFGKVWILWIESKPQLHLILQEVDNTADFDENHSCITPPNSELDLLCFKTLLEKNRNNQIDQETIQHFYDYGYFNEDERIQDLINQASPYEKIERQKQLAGLPDKIDKLSQIIDRLSGNIKDLDSRVTAAAPANELKQELIQHTTESHQHLDTKFQTLEQRVTGTHKLFDTRLTNIESGATRLIDLVNRINSLESRFSKLKQSVDAFEDKLSRTKSLNRQEISQLVNQRIEDRIKQLNPGVSGRIKSLEVKLGATEVAVSKIKSKITDKPRISTQALKIGERYKTKLNGKIERYRDEDDYLYDFCYCLRRFGVIGSEDEEIARAIHVALKAFPAVEIADARIIKVWRLMCDNHFKVTTINVEMGWLGLQDWFPNFFSRICFGKRLEQIDLETSIRKMLELGDMPWIIYFRYCDRSFPETYLSSFLDWISDFCHGSIKAFLIRCSGTNRCETNEDFYERVARLPKPKNREPIESQNLRPSGIPLTLSEWQAWCRSDLDIDSEYKVYYDFLEELRSVIENRGSQIPIELLREIQHYLRLSHNIIAKTCALDWGLTLRLLPWIGNRHRLIDIVQNLVNESNQELPHFQEGLQVAREADE